MLPRVATGTLDGHPTVRVGPPEGTPLVVVSGLNDPLLRVGDALWYTGLAAALGWRLRRKGYPGPVYVTSRPLGLSRSVTTREMARDLADALAPIGPVHILGMSMGGFIGQWLAHDHPERVASLVCGLAAARLSPDGRAFVERWREHADSGAWGRVYREGVDAVTDGVLRRLLRLPTYPYDWLTGSPPGEVDFDASARACLDHDATTDLRAVDVPALVIGGTADPFFDPAEFRQTADGLGTRWVRLEGLGHEALLSHSDAFDRPVVAFLTGER